MGLSASQARLLTITSRKSDCEFQSMRFSHEKIALSRSMADISNEYQNSLNQTKLIYDFYGNNDKSTMVSYGLFMQPSEMNGYMPILTTDSAGKVVLSSKYAAAARAAGIPTEGLGCLPSDTIRNRFLESLCGSGIITENEYDNYTLTTYSQKSGLGNIAAINQEVKVMNYTELLKYFDDIPVSVSGPNVPNDNAFKYKHGESAIYNGTQYVTGKTDDNHNEQPEQTITLKQLLEGDYAILCKGLVGPNAGGEFFGTGNECAVQFYAVDTIAAWWTTGSGADILDAIRKVLGSDDTQSQLAIQYADYMLEQMYGTSVRVHDGKSLKYDPYYPGDGNSKEYNIAANLGGADDKEFNYGDRNSAAQWMSASNILKDCSNYVGYYSRSTNSTTGWEKALNCQWESLSMNITNMLKAYLTYFANAMGNNSYKVSENACTLNATVTGNKNRNSDMISYSVSGSARTTNNCTFVDDNFEFNVVTNQTVDTDSALKAGFYDALFNQICTRGWIENDNVTNSEYLQEMYKNGMMFVTACSDDGFYYQNNYGSFSYIKEVTDDDAIARAEAKYNTEKAKLNHKEEILDLKMKKLDTEISALTTEYDTIKSLISKNIERGFKRYEA